MKKRKEDYRNRAFVSQEAFLATQAIKKAKEKKARRPPVKRMQRIGAGSEFATSPPLQNPSSEMQPKLAAIPKHPAAKQDSVIHSQARYLFSFALVLSTLPTRPGSPPR